jgi:glucose-1-phosphate adenylyltransferase
MSAVGIIFSNIHNETIDELTRKRTSASIPFGGRYRLIDFTLSNLVNANITSVGVLTQKNYQSLMDHLGSGKDWDLSRKNGGLIIFPPFSSHRSDFLYENRFEALMSVNGYISKRHEDYVVLTDCDNVNVIDYQKVLEQHEKSGADITIVYRNQVVTDDLADHMTIEVNEESRVTTATLRAKVGEKANVAVNVWVINRRLLEGLLVDAAATGAKSFHRDVLFANVKSLKIYGYNYEGVYLHMNSMENYYKGNMLLLNDQVRNELFGNQEKRIYTKVRDSAPTRYGEDAIVQNSFIADGCEIEGTVINSILFRGVKVAKGTVIKNSILMQDTTVGSNCNIDHVITDKNVAIRDRNNLMGCETVPYYLGKYATV